MDFRDLKQQYLVLKSEIDQAMLDVAASGSFIQGRPVGQLEQQLAAYAGRKYCIACANGTEAMTMVLKYWNIGPGDAVFVPDFTFFATAEVVCLEGATPVLVNVDPATFNLDPASLRQEIERIAREGRLKPRLIIPVDLFGLPADFLQISEIAREFGLLVLEDGAQGFGGAIGSLPACSFGNASTTSFFPAKPLGCYGDGGAIFTDDPEMVKFLRSYQVHGKGAEKYDNVRIGCNSRLDTLQAAILLVKFKAFQASELAAVQSAAAFYTRLLSDIVLTPVTPSGFSSSWAQYTIRLASSAQRDRLKSFLARQNIPSMIYYPRALHEQTALVSLADYEPHRLAKTSLLAQTVLSLPMHPYLQEEEITMVSEAVKDFILKEE